MNCPRCNTPNRDGANFCKHCGNLLVQSCPRCNSSLPDAALFCDHCGLRLAEPSGYGIWQTPPSGASSASTRSRDLPPVQSPSPARTSLPAAPSPVSGARLEQYIPQELKAKLDAARASGEMVGERKQVTVLFSDIVGSTALAEKLDPE